MSETEQGVAGVGLLVAAFNREEAGEQALKTMKQARKDGQFYYESAAVIRKEADGDVHYHETNDMSSGKGAGIGALVGGLIGILGGPAAIAIGAGAGALLGGAAAHGDAGFNDKSLEQLGTALKPGTSAVLAITNAEILRAFRAEVSEKDIQPALNAVASEISDRLLEGKDVILGLAITEEGISVRELAADDKAVELFGVVVTADGVLAGGAVVTEEGAAYAVAAPTEEGAVIVGAAATDDEAVSGVAVIIPVEETETEGQEKDKE